jgi:choline dehydrogenase-like flavoprotein
MIVDFEKVDFASDEVFDVCIIGAGAAGLSLAYQLIQDKKRVILLEGGGLNRWERRSQALNRASFSGPPYDGAHVGRFRGVGGSTSAWAGQIMEFDAIDFEKRPWVPGSSWPINKHELAPFYQRAAELEGIGGLQLDDKAIWPEIGAEEPDLGEDFELGFSRFCPEPKFARMFSPTINHPGWVLVTHANAFRLNFSPTSPEVVESVSFRSLGGKEGSVRARAFTLCLGGIESSRFLLNQTNTPWDKSGLVGKHFQDHVRCHAAEVRPRMADPDKWFLGPLPVARIYAPKIKLTAAAQKRYELLNVSGMIEIRNDMFRAMRTAAQIMLGPATSVTPAQVANMAVRAPALVWQRVKNRLPERHRGPVGKPSLVVICEQSPQSTSTIALANERDKIGMRRALINWDISEWEIRTIRTYVKLAMGFFDKSKLAEIVPDKRLFTDRVKEIIFDQFHHCGGTRMASNPDEGVVDPDLLLFGTSNAYVCSSSVFPSSSFGNPTHTVIALALRLAGHLLMTLSG